MGENTVGADGYCLILPIPGGNKVMYTACGIYTPDGGQTQRIGVSPDIEVKKTIEGIKEGRDELMEAAVEYIQEQKWGKDEIGAQNSSVFPAVYKESNFHTKKALPTAKIGNAFLL